MGENEKNKTLHIKMILEKVKNYVTIVFISNPRRTNRKMGLCLKQIRMYFI